MSSMIHIASEIDASKIEFGAVKLLGSGAKSVPLRYEGRNLMIETPSLNVPYGINKFDKTPGAAPKFSLDLSLRGADENEAIGALKDFMEAFDERLVQAGMENSNAWFKMAKPNEEVIKAFYTPLVKVSVDKEGNPKPYPPTFKLALRKRIIRKPGDKEGVPDPAETVSAFDTKFYNATEGNAEFSGDMKLEDVLPKRSQTGVIMQCTGLWFAGGKYGTTWKAVQVRVDSQPEQIRGPAFRSFATDAPDIKAFTARLTAAAPAPTGGSGTGYGGSGYGGYDDEEDAGDVLAAVAPAPVKKVTVAPAPAPEPAFEEEQVAEPVAVPAKKVVKKVVATKKP
jgi:hypothetical protein